MLSHRARRWITFCALGLIGLTLALPSGERATALDDVEQSRERGELATPAEVAARVDAILDAHHAKRELTAAHPVDDAGYYRRLSLDITGVIPRAEEARAFLANTDETKRTDAVEWMLASPDYAEYQADWWLTALVGRRPRAPRLQVNALRDWLRRHFEQKTPFDVWVRELIGAEGFIEESGPANFFWRYRVTPVEVSSRLTDVFMGVKVHCAQCHDHPYDPRLTRDRFWEQAAFFGRMRRVSYRAADEQYHDGLTEVQGGELRMPPLEAGEKPTPMKPRFLFQEDYADTGHVNRRQHFAAWLTGADNRLFKRTVVSRMWKQLLGADLYTDEPAFAFHDEVLDVLSEDFVASGYDLARVIRVITATRAYRRDSVVGADGAGADAEPEDFAIQPLRRLQGEQLARALLRASGQEEPQPDKNRARLDRFLRNNFRQYVAAFGQEALAERDDFEGSVPQMLLLFNAPLSNAYGPTQPRRPDPVVENRKIFRGSLAHIMRGSATDAARVDALWFWVLSRPPSEQERTEALALMPKGKGRTPNTVRTTYEDLFWVLINSAEFTFNH